jgi:hypothetical protein
VLSSDLSAGPTVWDAIGDIPDLDTFDSALRVWPVRGTQLIDLGDTALLAVDMETAAKLFGAARDAIPQPRTRRARKEQHYRLVRPGEISAEELHTYMQISRAPFRS